MNTYVYINTNSNFAKILIVGEIQIDAKLRKIGKIRGTGLG
jgi:hypothetical protein